MTVSARDVSFSFPNCHGGRLFSGLTLEFLPGNIFALLGFSGTGKTTLLRLLGGTLSPSEGEVSAGPAHKFGYVPQESSLLPWLTVQQNLELGSELLGLRSHSAGSRKGLAVSFGLDDHLDRRPRTLSGGMKQRASVISALTSGADVLLLDEPFAGSDRVRKAAMFQALRSFLEQVPDAIILFTTHDPGDVFALGATAVWLDSLSRRPTVISPRNGEWNASSREELLDLMIRESV